MIARSLSHTLRIIDQYQAACPLANESIKMELECLKAHMQLVIAHLEADKDEAIKVSLPKTLEEATNLICD